MLWCYQYSRHNSPLLVMFLLGMLQDDSAMQEFTEREENQFDTTVLQGTQRPFEWVWLVCFSIAYTLNLVFLLSLSFSITLSAFHFLSLTLSLSFSLSSSTSLLLLSPKSEKFIFTKYQFQTKSPWFSTCLC